MYVDVEDVTRLNHDVNIMYSSSQSVCEILRDTPAIRNANLVWLRENGLQRMREVAQRRSRGRVTGRRERHYLRSVPIVDTIYIYMCVYVYMYIYIHIYICIYICILQIIGI